MMITYKKTGNPTYPDYLGKTLSIFVWLTFSGPFGQTPNQQTL